MQAPARMTSARLGWSPTMDRRAVGVVRPVELDLAVDLGAVEHRPLDDVGVVHREAVFTAARFVMAPPMPTSASGVGRPPKPREVRGDRRARLRELRRHRAVQAEALGVARPRRRRR